MEELNLYKCVDGPADIGVHGGGHGLQPGGRQCLVRGDGETSLIRNGGRLAETEAQRCPLIPQKVKHVFIFSRFCDLLMAATNTVSFLKFSVCVC